VKQLEEQLDVTREKIIEEISSIHNGLKADWCETRETIRELEQPLRNNERYIEE
jgi:hypothetical protein